MKKRLSLLLTAALMMLLNSVIGQDKRAEVLLRVDDVGMNHSINQAVEDLCKTGISFSAW